MLPLIDRRLVRLAKCLAVAAGGIDQYVDLAVPVDQSFDSVLDLLLLADIEREGERVASSFLNAQRSGICALGHEVTDANLRTTSGKGAGRDCSDPLAGARNQNDFAIEALV